MMEIQEMATFAHQTASLFVEMDISPVQRNARILMKSIMMTVRICVGMPHAEMGFYGTLGMVSSNVMIVMLMVKIDVLPSVNLRSVEMGLYGRKS